MSRDPHAPVAPEDSSTVVDEYARMEGNHVKGLLGSVGKAIAQAPRMMHARARLEEVASREAFRDFLERAELGIAPPAKRAFIDAVTGPDWVDYKSQLEATANRAYADYKSPSA